MHKKSLPIIASPSRKVSPSPADNLPATIRLARSVAWRGGFLPVDCRPGETFLKGGLIMGHRSPRRELLTHNSPLRDRPPTRVGLLCDRPGKCAFSACLRLRSSGNYTYDLRSLPVGLTKTDRPSAVDFWSYSGLSVLLNGKDGCLCGSLEASKAMRSRPICTNAIIKLNTKLK